MRSFLTLCMAVAIVTFATRAAFAAPPTSLDLHADRVSFFSNRYIVTGEGHVSVRLSDGTMLRGNYFSMDLKLNRYLLAGDVHLDGDGVHEIGAAFAGYPDLDRSYFLPAHGDPDRWTYFGLDFKTPQKGRQQPGDAFFIPDLSDSKAFILAKGATIIPKTNVAFQDARVYVLGVYIPTLKYVQNFSANPNFAQNAFSGATADIGLFTNGSAHALTGFHFRYSGIDKGYLSFDQHFAWERDYIVFSINPLTREQRQFNLIGYKRISPKMEARVFSQLSTAQHGIYEPENASAYTNLSSNIALKHFVVSLAADQYNTSLKQFPVGYDDQKSYEHPADASIGIQSFDAQVKHTPFSYRVRAGYAVAHDGYHCGLNAQCPNDPANASGMDRGYVLQYFGRARTRVDTIWQHYLGVSLYSSSIKLNRNTFVNISFDKQRQWFSLPHYIDTTASTFSLSKIYGTKLAVFGAYAIQNVGDHYGARQLEFYPPFGPITTSTGTYTSFSAFRGFSTSRVLTGSTVFTPNSNFNVNLALRRYYDFPAPIPGSFGNPPWQLTTEVRLRIFRQVLMDVTRTTYFNFGGVQPSFGVNFGP